MRQPRLTLLVLLLLLSTTMLLSACAGAAVNSNWPAVAVNGGTAYLAFGPQIHAVNLETGAKIWSFPAKADNAINFYAAPALSADGQLIVGSYDHKLYSVNPASGAQIWVFAEAKDLFVASPLVTERAIYAPNADGILYALDLKGNKLWQFETGHALWASPVTDPACACIYLASMDHRLYALNAETGELLWQTEDLVGALVAPPVFGPDGLLYLGTFGSEMIAVHAKDGSIAWRYPTQGWVFSAPALQDNILYFGDLAGYLHAIDAKSGSGIWQKQVGQQIVSTPLVQDGAIYLSDRTATVRALNLQGEPRWEQQLDIKIEAPVVSANGSILVAPSNTKEPLIAFNSEGVRKWGFDPNQK